MGVTGGPPPVTGDWLADPARWDRLRGQLAEAVAAHAKRDPLAIGMAPEAARAALGLPGRALVEALARPPGKVRLEDGYLRPRSAPSPRSTAPGLPPRVAAGVRAILADLAAALFLAPEAGRLRDLGLDARAVAAAARAGLLLRLTEQIVLAPGAEAAAAPMLAELPQPFTAPEARQALGTTRRVAIPLLEYLDRSGVTERLPDDRRLRLARGRLAGPRAVPWSRAAVRRLMTVAAKANTSPIAWTRLCQWFIRAPGLLVVPSVQRAGPASGHNVGRTRRNPEGGNRR
jgi:selenocysteine-specific elongation factor